MFLVAAQFGVQYYPTVSQTIYSVNIQYLKKKYFIFLL